MQEIRLADYQAPKFFIDRVELEFDIFEGETFVSATMAVKRNGSHTEPLVLNGEELELLELRIAGQQVTDYNKDKESLTITSVPDNFTLATKVKISPEHNSVLSGLYKSKNIYCTQCESHGFRRISYFVDRPDNLARFTVTIRASAQYPVLLSNGNLIASGELEENRHWAKWEDPSLKPCYLFALVAGELEWLEDKFVTSSGREVILRVYAELGYKNRCSYALESLKRAMRWDEKVFGREYELDIYMIVAVDDFTSGAMENKGLNIFNSKYVFVDEATATDQDYINVENVVAHEYFHNWTGNRVTCRNWFQITLKEGLTMFRDQLFSADMTSHAVKRIEEANIIRSMQFAEDAGPMAHPPQPKSYIAMDNFYTVTVYHKGAEIVRMLYTMLSKEKFRAGMDLYFKRHDGQAVTINEFLQAMQDASGRDLTQFANWYHEAGTPRVTVTSSYKNSEYRLTIKQDKNRHIPIALGLVNSKGDDLVNTVVELTKPEQEFIFDTIPEQPIPSLLRNFSAPVKLSYNYSEDELLFLMAHDTDSFAQWNAGQELAVKYIFKLLGDYQQQKELKMPGKFIKAIRAIVSSAGNDNLFTSLLLTLPNLSYLIELSEVADVAGLFAVTEFMTINLARALEAELITCYHKFAPDSIGNRRLRNLCLYYLSRLQTPEIVTLCVEQFNSANNMTETMGALRPLANLDIPERAQVLAEFYDRWQHEPLVVNKWLEVQATCNLPDTLERVKALTKHKAFDIRNPNKVYSLIRAFAKANPARFHDSSGAGYEFLADKVLELDKINPPVAGRIVEPLIHWQKFPKTAQKQMHRQLERILKQPKLSKNVYELVSKAQE